MPENDLVSVRYMVDDVEESIDFYTRHLGFTLRHSALPAFADVVRGRLRLLLAGPESSAGRPMPDGRKPGPGGWNRIHLIVDDIARRGRAPSLGRALVSQRHRQRARRPADPARGSLRQRDRALPAGGHIAGVRIGDRSRTGAARPPAGRRASAAAGVPGVVRQWRRIGCIGFGGPLAHIALLRELCVTRPGTTR